MNSSNDLTSDRVKITAIMKPKDKIEKKEYEFIKSSGQVKSTTRAAVIKSLRSIFEKNLVNNNKVKPV